MGQSPEQQDGNEHLSPDASASASPEGEGADLLRLRSPADILAAIPYSLGFQPEESLVVLGLGGPRRRISLVVRYNLAGEPSVIADIANHARTVLQQNACHGLFLVGYGTGQQVTPLVDELRATATDAQLSVHDALRVEDGRYWSYTCPNEACCPAEGTPFDLTTSRASAEMVAFGATALAGRNRLAQLVEPTRSKVPDQIFKETTGKMLKLAGQSVREVVEVGRQHVQEALRIAREGGRLDDRQVAWLALTMRHPAVRDDAWARMDPAHCQQHRELWVDVMRRTPDKAIAAPGSLLAFTAWQCGNGGLANVALERVLRVDPDYSMARLLRDAIASGVPPGVAVLPMTPEQVAASYDANLRPDQTPGGASQLDVDDPAIRDLYDLPPREAPSATKPERSKAARPESGPSDGRSLTRGADPEREAGA